MVIICGIHPGTTSGTGDAILHITEQASNNTDTNIRFIFGKGWEVSLIRCILAGNLPLLLELLRQRYSCTQYLKKVSRDRTVIEADELVLIHPQSLGFKVVLDIIEARTKPLWLFLLDSSFFCIKSYNHIAGETKACLRCLGNKGNDAIKKYACKAFPNNDSNALLFVQKLKDYVAAGHVKILAQNQNQASLARKHFGSEAIINVVGIWGKSWTSEQAGKANNSNAAIGENIYDVVYHASQHPAKGSSWAITVAERCPKVNFLFPFHKFPNYVPRENMTFKSMTWKTGLKEAVSSAKLTLVPTLWSAPVEGALIKSLIHSRRVAVVDIETSFSAELPSNIILKLSQDPTEAAKELECEISENRMTNLKDRNHFNSSFAKSNIGLLDNILEVILLNQDC